MVVIEYKKASRWFGEVIALNEVDFKINPGITGLVGSNGAGKTSTIKLGTSLIKPTLGRVTVDGEDIWQNLDYLKITGYSPEVDRLFYWLSGRKFLRWMSRFYSMPKKYAEKRVEEVLKLMGMTHAADRLISTYSRGMRQRIKVGQALLNEPSVLFLDEPMSGTDALGRIILADIIRDLGKEGLTIVVSSHVLHELERIVDRIIVLEKGKLVAEGTIAGVRDALAQIPHSISINTNKPKELAKKIINMTEAIRFKNNLIIAEIKDRNTFYKQLVDIQQKEDIIIKEIYPIDQDLTSLYNMLKTYKST